MAEFCPECPRKGDCEGTITDVYAISSRTGGTITGSGKRGDPQTATFSVEMGIPQGPTVFDVQFAGKEGGKSDVIGVYGETYELARNNAATFERVIEKCNGPVVERKFPWIRQTVTCGVVTE